MRASFVVTHELITGWLECNKNDYFCFLLFLYVPFAETLLYTSFRRLRTLGWALLGWYFTLAILHCMLEKEENHHYTGPKFIFLSEFYISNWLVYHFYSFQFLWIMWKCLWQSSLGPNMHLQPKVGAAGDIICFTYSLLLKSWLFKLHVLDVWSSKLIFHEYIMYNEFIDYVVVMYASLPHLPLILLFPQFLQKE